MALTLTAAELAEAIGVDSAAAARLLPVATALVTRYAPDAPAAISNEAAIRCAGWLSEQPNAAITSETEGDIRTSYAPSMLSALRHSGGMALLSPWKNRRAGAIMTRRLALRRFPNEVVRRRQGPGTRNFYGEFEPGPVVETIYPAKVLPLSLEDTDFVGGVSLLERLKVFVPRGIARRRGEGEALAWAGSVLTWNGEPLRWGGGDGTLIDDDSVPFLAAFDDRQADTLVYSGIELVVEESQSWPRYARVIALRET